MLFGTLAGLACLAAAIMSSCSSLAPAQVKQESGYYYGFGSGATRSEALAEAKRDLIANALTEQARARGSVKGPIAVDAAAAAAFELPKLKPVAREKGEGRESVAVSLKAEDWHEHERAREAAIRAELRRQLATLRAESGQPLSQRMQAAAGMLDRLAREGLTELLSYEEQGDLLMSAAIEGLCREACAGLSITIQPEGGFIGPETRFQAVIRDRDGAPAASLPLRLHWSPRAGEAVSQSARSGADGSLPLAYPTAEALRNTGVRLTVGTDFARSSLENPAAASAAFQDIDAASRVEARYRHFDDARAFFSDEVRVPGGPFTVGAVPQDRRAARKEAPRPAEVADFHVDLHPVTNALYEMYLEDTRAERLPEYWDNPRYNQPDQPVVGVSYGDAVEFAAWLSAQLGVLKRLPTEEEWEKAARGGQQGIYPWGDESPTDGVRANYSGNGRFSGPSAVGSFEAGKNAYGIFDMAGNVWQWTSTSDGGGGRIVKGGSWMDGPADLRVSNRREVDASRGYVDVGFRLIREVTNETEVE